MSNDTFGGSSVNTYKGWAASVVRGSESLSHTGGPTINVYVRSEFFTSDLFFGPPTPSVGTSLVRR